MNVRSYKFCIGLINLRAIFINFSEILFIVVYVLNICIRNVGSSFALPLEASTIARMGIHDVPDGNQNGSR